MRNHVQALFPEQGSKKRQMTHTPVFQTLEDILTFEQLPLEDRQLPQTTYESLCRGAAIDPEAPTG